MIRSESDSEYSSFDTTPAGAVLSAAGLSGVASFVGLCCAGPWAVAVLGVPGAVLLARFDFLRPWLLAAATLMLAWAFWRTYIARPACDDGVCATGPSPWLQTGLWTAAALTAAAWVAPELQWLLVDPTPEALR